MSIVGIATILIASSVLMNPFAFADDDDNKKGKASMMRGIGTGTVTCDDGTTVSGVTIQLDFTRDSSRGDFGSYTLRSSSSDFESAEFRDGKLTKSKYDFDGIQRENPSSRAICNGVGPTLTTMSGDCGLGVTITIEAVGNLKGTFTGNVACA